MHDQPLPSTRPDPNSASLIAPRVPRLRVSSFGAPTGAVAPVLRRPASPFAPVANPSATVMDPPRAPVFEASAVADLSALAHRPGAVVVSRPDTLVSRVVTTPVPAAGVLTQLRRDRTVAVVLATFATAFVLAAAVGMEAALEGFSF